MQPPSGNRVDKEEQVIQQPRLAKHLPFEVAKPGTLWLRIHDRRRDSLWFGPAPGSPPVNRFDDPEGHYRVCYLGTTMEACFAETFLRNPPVRILSLADLSVRCVTTFEVIRAGRLVQMHGPGLARTGATAGVTAGPSYVTSQSWARAVWAHADSPDGLIYRSRHDDSSFCIALFDRAKGVVAASGSVGLASDPLVLGRLLKRYSLGLTR